MSETECVYFFLDSVVASLISLSSSPHRGLALAESMVRRQQPFTRSLV